MQALMVFNLQFFCETKRNRLKGCVGNENFTQKTTFTIGEMLQKIVLNVDFTEKTNQVISNEFLINVIPWYIM